MKKIFILSALALFSTTVFATPFDGFYAGAGIGGARGKFNNDVMTDATVVIGGTEIQDISHNNNLSVGDSSWAGSLDVGFSKVLHQNIYLGIEAAGQLENIKNNNSYDLAPTASTGIHYTRQITSQLQNELAVTFNPGIILHKNTLLYGKIGPTWGRFSTNDDFDFSETLGPGQQLAGGIDPNNGGSYKCGLRLGLGIEHYMTDRLSLRLEYLNSNYGTINSGKTHSAPMLFNGIADPTYDGSTVSASDDVAAHSNTILLGINYHFNA